MAVAYAADQQLKPEAQQRAMELILLKGSYKRSAKSIAPQRIALAGADWLI